MYLNWYLKCCGRGYAINNWNKTFSMICCPKNLSLPQESRLPSQRISFTSQISFFLTNQDILVIVSIFRRKWGDNLLYIHYCSFHRTFWTGMRWQFIAIVRAARFVKLSLEIQPTNVVKGHSICVFLYTRQLMQQLPSQLNEYSTIFYPVSKTPLPFCPENLKIFPKNLKTFPKNLKTFPKNLQTP